MKLGDERIIELINPTYLERVPSFVRKHATACSCKMIARDYPELYEAFSGEQPPGEEEKKMMSGIINDIFEKRMNKHSKERAITQGGQ